MIRDSGLLCWATLYIVSGGALNSTHSPLSCNTN